MRRNRRVPALGKHPCQRWSRGQRVNSGETRVEGLVLEEETHAIIVFKPIARPASAGIADNQSSPAEAPDDQQGIRTQRAPYVGVIPPSPQFVATSDGTDQRQER
jgi:hypothetical protein